MEVLDFFSGDGYSIASMTDAISHVDYVPRMLGNMGLFGTEGVPSRTIIVEEDNGALRLVQTSQFGGPGRTRSNDKRKVRSFVIPHISLVDNITAEEIQNVRAYAQGRTPQQALLMVNQLRDRKLAALKRDIEATLEFHRIGALKGLILDADGSTIYDLFAEFEVTQQTQDMLLNTTSTEVIVKITEAMRKAQNALKGDEVQSWFALCGDSFFDKLTSHTNVKAFYTNWQAAQSYSQEQKAYRAFPFGNVMWINYRGAVTGSDGNTKTYVATDRAYLVPQGSQSVFVGKYGPSDFIERVNQIPDPNGLPIEVRSEIKDGKRVEIEAQSNPLMLCAKPAAVVMLKEHN